MDVRCPRCATDYEFDDALISERGTTVKCTNCGHQFKIFAESGRGAVERWVVRTRSGSSHVYTSLKELQRAISQGAVDPEDLLSRGDQAPRRLSAIAELEGFFRNRPARSQLPLPVPTSRTLHGLAPPEPPRTESTSTPKERPASKEPRTQASPLEPLAPAPVMAPAVPALAELEPARPHVGSTQPAPYAPAPALSAAFAASEAPEATLRYPDHVPNPNLQPPAAGAAIAAEQAAADPPPAAARSNLVGLDLEPGESVAPFDSSPPKSLRWLWAVVALGLVAFVAVTWGNKLLTDQPGPSEQAALPLDPRVQQRLASANELVLEGELESAKELLDQAIGLAEGSLDVLIARAELEVLRADFEWLRLRALAAEPGPLRELTRRDLKTRLDRASAALAQVTDAQAVLRPRVDLLRMQGQLRAARAEVTPLSQVAADPRSAYVLGALDLAEPKPDWPVVLERLSSAASAEGALGRAQSALVIALAESGSATEATRELRRLHERNPRHPLQVLLTAFVERHSSADISAESPAPSTEALPEPPAQAVTAQAVPSAPDAHKSFQGQLEQASLAMKKGDTAAAERFYENVLRAQPNNTEALGGLAEIAQRRGDQARAAQLYDRILETNPNYLPAMMGSADYKWQTGNRRGAELLYRQVVDRVGSTSSYGRRAQARLDEASGQQPSPPLPPTTEPPAPAVPTQTSASPGAAAPGATESP